MCLSAGSAWFAAGPGRPAAHEPVYDVDGWIAAESVEHFLPRRHVLESSQVDLEHSSEYVLLIKYGPAWTVSFDIAATRIRLIAL